MRSDVDPQTDAFAKLVSSAEAGLARRIEQARRSDRTIDERIYRERGRQELDVIQRLGFTQNFLIVAELVDTARARGVRIGAGRGAVPGSLVAWALGITDIDPIKFKLVFERFLNVERANSWSLSIDVCARRRSELLDHFGHDRLERRLIAHGLARQALGSEVQYEDLASTVEPLLALTIVQDVLDRVSERTSVDIAALDPDAAVFAMIARGDTYGVFWFDEDDEFAVLAQRLAPSCLDDLMLIFTLLRPGPMERGAIETVVDRKHRRTSRDAVHRALEPVLADTYGVLVYQEQLIQIAHEVAGYPYTQGDLLRRTLGRRRPVETNDAGHRFVSAAIANGMDGDEAHTIFDHLVDMSGLGFSRAHAAGYSWLAYQTAYLKHYFPVEFAGALEDHQHHQAELYR